MDDHGPCDNCGNIAKLTSYKAFSVCYPCWFKLSEDGESAALDRVDYDYISFIKTADKPKTSVWKCVNGDREDEVLGLVKWYSRWRQYCFFPTTSTVFNSGCMADVIDFIQKAECDRTSK